MTPCPNCGGRLATVKTAGPRLPGELTRRLRRCQACRAGFWTRETAVAGLGYAGNPRLAESVAAVLRPRPGGAKLPLPAPRVAGVFLLPTRPTMTATITQRVADQVATAARQRAAEAAAAYRTLVADTAAADHAGRPGPGVDAAVALLDAQGITPTRFTQDVAAERRRLAAADLAAALPGATARRRDAAAVFAAADEDMATATRRHTAATVAGLSPMVAALAAEAKSFDGAVQTALTEGDSAARAALDRACTEVMSAIKTTEGRLRSVAYLDPSLGQGDAVAARAEYLRLADTLMRTQVSLEAAMMKLSTAPTDSRR